MATEWVNITAAAFYGDYTGYIRYANQVLNITGAMSSASANGLRVFSIEPNTHYRVTMVMQNRFRLGCVPNLTSGQTVTNYVFDPLDTNGAANQGTSRTLEITSGANQIYLCVGAWSSGAGDTLENTLATIVVEVEQEVAIQQYTVTFTTYDGTVLKTELVNKGEDATPPADPVRDGYRFVGWSGSYTNVTANLTLTAWWSKIVTYTVTFKSYNDTVLKTETVEQYGDATAPDVPERPGYVFKDWNGAFTYVCYDLTITAQYAAYIYSVRFYDDEETLLQQHAVYYGTNASNYCYPPARLGGVFTGWSAPCTSVQSDLELIAQYDSVPVYTVTFLEDDGVTVLGTQQVNAGDSAYLSHKSTRSGYAFAGWGETATGSSISNIQSDMTVRARYKTSPYSVQVLFYDNDSTTVLLDVWVPEGGSATPPAPPEHEGLIFYGWSNSSYLNVVSYYAGSKVYVYARYGAAQNTVTYKSGSTVLKTETVPFGGNATPPQDPTPPNGMYFTEWSDDGVNIRRDTEIYAQFSSIPSYQVVFRDYDKLLISSSYVQRGQTATLPPNPTREGFTFLGWDGDHTNIQADALFTARYAGVVYTVTFLNDNGDTLKTELVEEGTAATAPAVPVYADRAFSGWDVSFDDVRSDLTVTAQYAINSYTVQFLDHDGAVLQSEVVQYGEDATPPALPSRAGFTFLGWSEAYTNVHAHITTTAQYRQLQTYTVRFLSYTSRAISTQLVVEGEAATPPIAPLRPGYAFTGWSADTSTVTADMTVSAVYARNASPLVLEVCSGGTPVMTIPKVTAATLRDSLEGELTLSFSTLSRLAANVQTGQTVRLRDLYFSIVRVQKSIAQGMWLTTVTCEHISYVLNDDDYKITELDFTGSPSNALTQVLDGTPLNVGVVEYSGNVTLQINQECTRRAALMQLIALLGGEIEYDGYDINIRTHRGSQTAKQLMESRNVTNVGVTHDSRSSTASYEIAFFNLIDIAVGDLVHIVFSPLGIDVETRIICLEYNPFHPYDARVEIGGYVPTINDSLYRLEQQIGDNIGEDIEQIRTDIETLDTDLTETQEELSALEETVSGITSARDVTNLSVGEDSFSVSFSDGTHATYNYYMDLGGHITSIVKQEE